MAGPLSRKNLRHRLLVMPGLYALTGLLAGLAIAPFAEVNFPSPNVLLPAMGATMSLALAFPCAISERGGFRVLGAMLLAPLAVHTGSWIHLTLLSGDPAHTLTRLTWTEIVGYTLALLPTSLLHHVVLERRRPFPPLAWLGLGAAFLLAQILGDIAADVLEGSLRHGTWPEFSSFWWTYWLDYIFPLSVLTAGAVFAAVAATRRLLPKEEEPPTP